MIEDNLMVVDEYEVLKKLNRRNLIIQKAKQQVLKLNILEKMSSFGYYRNTTVGNNAMTALDDIMKLDNYEDEDIFDVVIKLERSFGLKFEKDAFYTVKTFGDLCDVFENHITYDHRSDCTKQQAFYQVRKAIGATQKISEDQIKLDTELIDLFPRQNRRRKAIKFKSYLGANIELLTYPWWLALIFGIGFILSLVTFFFDWKIALVGIVFFISAMKIADKLGKDLDLQTVRELTEKLSRENYIDIRRTKGTINRREILQTIIDTFSNDLAIDKTYLTRDAKFSWTPNKSTATNSGLASMEQDE